jgi:hypothetical protein
MMKGLQPTAVLQRLGVADARGVCHAGGARGVGGGNAPRLDPRGLDVPPGTHIMTGTEHEGRSLRLYNSGDVRYETSKFC